MQNPTHPFSLVPLTSLSSLRTLLTTLLDPLHPFFSPLKSRIRIPGATAVRFDQTASEVEGLCRPLWGLACLLAGGGAYHGTESWIEGIRNGVDPEGKEFWSKRTAVAPGMRSEERRVGKECRSRWSPYH